MKRVISLILLIVLLVNITPIVYADETNNITFTADKTTVNVGDTITVTLKTSQKIEAADFSIKYSNDILKFLETSINSDHYADNNGIVKVSNFITSGTDTFTFKFEVIGLGNGTISTDIEALNIDEKRENVLTFENETINIKSELKVTLDKTNLTLQVGETADLTVTVYPETEEDIEWTSSDTSVATVNEGTITAVSEGTTTITVKVGEVTKTCTVTVTKKDEDSQLPLGERIEAEFTDEYTDIEIKEPHSGNKKVSYKIGEVTDLSIVKAVKSNPSNGLNSLLEFARKDTKGQTGTLNTGRTESILDKLNLKENTYYYVYLKTIEENEENEPIEDVSLYIFKSKKMEDGTIKKTLPNYKSDDFDWSGIESETTKPDDSQNKPNNNNGKDPTTADKDIPAAGETITILASVITLIAIAVISIIKYRRYRDI